jgi:hypothetical protein
MYETPLKKRPAPSLKARRTALNHTPDPLTISAFRGRLAAAWTSLSVFTLAAQSLWAKAAPLMADGLTLPGAIHLLNESGPMLSAGADLGIMALSLASAAAAAVSKWRETRRTGG